MSETVKRISPRRPFHITPEGLKRIVLGEVGEANVAIQIGAHRDNAPKPLRLFGEPSGYLLVIAHSDRGALDAHAQQAIAAAALLAAKSTAVALLVLGELSDDVSAYGADRVYVAPGCDKAVFNPTLELAFANGLITQLQPQYIVLPDNAIGDGDLGRRLVARLGLDAATHVVEVKPAAVAAYWQGGAQVARRDLPRLVLLDADTTDTTLPFRGAGEIVERQQPPMADSVYTDLGSPAVDFSTLGLEEADFIVSAGNGVNDVPTLHAVAKTFDAAVGASRVAVDDGKFARAQQIGATGKTVNASVYMAIGISGAVQHLQGIKAVRHVIAINTDASAPIAKRAALTIVDDAQQVMEQLLEATRSRNFVGHQAAVQTPIAHQLRPSSSPYQRGGARWGSAPQAKSPDADIEAPIPPPNLPSTAEGTNRAPGDLRVTVLASLGRNPVSGVARPNGNDVLALNLARHIGGTLSVVHAGDSAEPALADYLAYGARTIDAISMDADRDVASALAGQLAGQDLILCGTRAEGGEGSGLAPYLVAQQLGLPVVAQALEISVASGFAEITQGLPKGQRRKVRVQLPAVVIVHPKAQAKPRFAYAQKLAGRITSHPATNAEPSPSVWHIEPTTKRPVKFKAAETKAGHARMLSAIATEAKGGAVISTGTPADKAQAILSYLREHKLIDW